MGRKTLNTELETAMDTESMEGKLKKKKRKQTSITEGYNSCHLCFFELPNVSINKIFLAQVLKICVSVSMKDIATAF